MAYLTAGQLGAHAGMGWTLLALALLALLGLIAALKLWPSSDPQSLPHAHEDLPHDHPHLQGYASTHVHEFVIDDLHRAWPRTGV